MAINYTWNCNTVDVYPSENGEDNVIYNIHWKITGTESDAGGSPHVSSVYGTQEVDTSDLSNFVPFDQVTNAMATTWVQEAMGTEEVDKNEALIADEISELKNPTTETKQLIS